MGAAEQSLAADGAIACFSSSFAARGLDADRAPQLKAIVGCSSYARNSKLWLPTFLLFFAVITLAAMKLLIYLGFLVLGISSLRGVRWAYITFVILGLLYFPASVGFRLNPQPCELVPNRGTSGGHQRDPPLPLARSNSRCRRGSDRGRHCTSLEGNAEKSASYLSRSQQALAADSPPAGSS